MRTSFRAKILIALVATVTGVLGAALWAVGQAQARELEELTEERARLGTSIFEEIAQRQRERLTRQWGDLAKSSRMLGALDEGGADEPIGIALNETDEPLVAVARRSGRAEWRLNDAPLSEPPAYTLDADEPLSAMMVVGRRLFNTMAGPCYDGDRRLGAVLLGTEITDDVARRANVVPGDHVAYLVDGAAVASSFPTRPSSVAPEMTIDGEPYRVIVTKVDGRVSTATFVGLGRLERSHREMRSRLMWAGTGGLLVAVALGLVISRGVSAPVRDLVVGTRRVAEGEYSHTIAVRSNDELGDLAVAFNRMAGDLALKEKARSVLNKVVAPEVAEELLRGDLALGGSVVRATLLFLDLRGFTAMTQGMPPQEVVSMLNEFMTAMTREVLACGGIVDKYVGDEIVALFGVPRPRGHDALAALEAADRMRRRLADLNVVREGRGQAPLAMGIGIHTGEVVAGRMGSEQQLSFTCIGEAMNLAARLCSNAKAGQILASRDTLEEAGEGVEAKPLAPLSVKGFAEPVAVSEVVRVTKGATARRAGK